MKTLLFVALLAIPLQVQEPYRKPYVAPTEEEMSYVEGAFMELLQRLKASQQEINQLKAKTNCV
jgi:hypothetical protein